MGRPSIGKPAAGTFSISIFPSAPTNRNWASLSRSRTALAMAMAGKMCPPVPPPEIITLSERCSWSFGINWLFFFLFEASAYAQHDPDREAGEPDGCATHAHERQRLSGNGYKVHGHGHVDHRLHHQHKA